MVAPACAPLLLLLLLAELPAAAESLLWLPAPQNVTVQSYNFQNVLRWAPVKVNNGSVVYSVEYRTLSSPVWEEVNCTNITKTECDFTSSNIRNYYSVNFRVRAQQGHVKSDWVVTPRFFQAEKDTVLGPPRAISVTSGADSLVISYLPPFKEKETSYFTFTYYVYFWEASGSGKKIKTTKNTQCKLEKLRQLTVYCFQVQAGLNEDVKGLLSDTYCQKTTANDATWFGYVALIFFASIIIVGFVAFLCFRLAKKLQVKMKYWFQPFEIPQHYKEFLRNPSMSILENMEENRVGEDYWDSLSIISAAEKSQTLVQ
uniref:Tissue factor n=1 Tax=Sphenodon punctatus TaxID=8508 RepID=A0A8D0L8E8_SPHPU